VPQWIEIGLRTLIAAIALFFLTKLLGKRQVSELSLFEYITGITIGSLAAYISLDLDAAWYLGIVSLAVWVGISFLLEVLNLKSKSIRDFVEGESLIIMKGGKILEDNLKKARYTSDDLLEKLRSKSVFNMADVEFAILEADGELNILLKKANLPLTLKSLGKDVPSDPPLETVVMDGNIIDEALSNAGFNRGWLDTELEKQGIAIENVYLAQVDHVGQLFIDVYDDKLNIPAPQLKATLFANLKKCEADVEMFGLSTNDKEVKAMYTLCSQQLQEVIKDTRPLLT
jgi:uncharacterized membrane protein YcaP (DUF421 family)